MDGRLDGRAPYKKYEAQPRYSKVNDRYEQVGFFSDEGHRRKPFQKFQQNGYLSDSGRYFKPPNPSNQFRRADHLQSDGHGHHGYNGNGHGAGVYHHEHRHGE